MIKHVIAPLSVAVMFAGSFIAAKYTTFDLEPLTTSLLRYLVAFIFLFVFSAVKRRNPFKVDKADLLKLTMLGLTGIVGYHFFFFTSLKYTAVTNTGIINATNPILTAIAAGILLKEKLSLKTYIGIGISFIAVLILLSKGNMLTIINLNFQYGDILMFCAVLSWVAYALIIKSLIKKYDSFTLTFYATLTGVIFLFFLSLTENPVEQLSNISTASSLSVLYMGIFASGIGYLIYNYGIKNIGPTKMAGIVYSCVPIMVAALSFFLLDEKLSTDIIISIVLIVLGMNFILSVKPDKCK